MTSVFITFILFWIAGVADFLVQSVWWGWVVPWGWKISSEAKKLVWWLDWFPHDSWHVSQFIRNLFWIVGSWLIGFTFDSWWVSLGIVIGLYILSRGTSSSLLIKWSKRISAKAKQ